MLQLQQAAGNQAVVQLLADGHRAPPPLTPGSRAGMGNRAMAAMLTGVGQRSRVLQRAPGPLDETVPALAMANTAPAGESAGGERPVPVGAVTGAGTLPPPTARPGGTGAVSQPGNEPMLPVGGGGPIGVGGAAGPGQFGAVDQTAKQVPLLKPRASEVPGHAVEATYAKEPARVFRSPSDDWHYQLWNFHKAKGYGSEPPPAFKVGSLIAVSPDYQGRATPIPSSYSGDDRTGLGTPTLPTQSPLDRTAPPPERPMTRAVAPGVGGAPGFGGTPGFVPGPQGPGRQTAVAVSTVDILAAMKADPKSVYRSPDAAWHAQMFRLDQGKGSTAPTAFRVGNQILVAPDHPIKGVPTIAILGGGAPGTAGPPGAPGAAPGAGPAPATTPTTTGGRRTKGSLDVTKGAAPGLKGEVTVEDESTDGDKKIKKARGASGSVGGGNIASLGGQSSRTEAVGDASTTTKKAASLTLKPDGSLVIGSEKSKETFKGTNEAGAPIKTGGTTTNKSLALGEKGLTGQVGRTRETAGGHKVGAAGSFTADDKGNVSGTGSLKLESKGGTSLTPSMSGGVSVQASDPIPAEGGGYDVTYTVTTSSGVGLGAGKQFGGGPSVGLQVGSTSATMETGSRHFDDQKKANAFRDKAAQIIAGERFLQYPPPTSVEGALLIPIGEERGSGDMSGSNVGGSVAFKGASLGYGKSESTTHQFKVRRVSDKLVRVTGSVSGTKGSDVTGSGGITLTRGSSTVKAFEVVWEIDLGTKAGRTSFELYAKTGYPPLGAKFISMTSSGSGEDHDDVSVPLLGKARWSGTTWEVIKTDAGGGRKAQFGGQKAHKQDPSWIGKNILGQDKLSSSAQITSSLESGAEGGEQEGFEAEVKVSSDSGEYNRRQLGEIFMGVPTTGDVKPSGEWTLTATVSPDVVRELERLNKDMRRAWSKEDMLRAYSKLVKERGARMVGAQVARGGDEHAWTLELKGDKNFPGRAGRATLDAKRAELRGKLKDAAAAKAVVSEAQKTLDELRARRIAIADKGRYTDLPDGLRDQQLKLVDKHVSDFEFIRHHALRTALKREAGAGKPDAAKPGAAAPDAEAAGGYAGSNEAAESADMLKLRAAIDQKEAAISALDPRISRGINAVTQASTHTAYVSPYHAGWVMEHRASYSQHWASGMAINERQYAMARPIDALRQKLLESQFAVDRKAAATALLAQLTDRLLLLETLHLHVVSAAEALKPITTAKGMKGYPRYWGSIKGDTPPWADGLGSSED